MVQSAPIMRRHQLMAYKGQTCIPPVPETGTPTGVAESVSIGGPHLPGDIMR